MSETKDEIVDPVVERRMALAQLGAPPGAGGGSGLVYMTTAARSLGTNTATRLRRIPPTPPTLTPRLSEKATPARRRRCRSPGNRSRVSGPGWTGQEVAT